MVLLAACDQTTELSPDKVIIESASGRHQFTIELARTPEAQARGLMYRREMADNHGMLFDFPTEREAHFWMRNTYLSLDMIFILSDGTIHHIAEGTVPLSDRIISSNGPVNAVLEVVGGTASRLGLRPGDKVRHPIFETSAN